MLISTWLQSFRNHLNTGSRKNRVQRTEMGQSESLESRQMLTSPQLVGVDAGPNDPIPDAGTIEFSPTEITLEFDAGQILDAATINNSTIAIDRAGGDGVLDGAADVPVSVSFVGLGDLPNEVTVRFAGALPSDLYRITIDGDSGAPLANTDAEAFNNGADLAHTFTIEQPGPLLNGIETESGEFLEQGDVLESAPREFTLLFTPGLALDPATVTTDSIIVTRAGHDNEFASSSIPVEIGFVGITDDSEVTVRLTENLVDDDYLVTVIGSGANALVNSEGRAFNDGEDDTFAFSLELGARIVAVDPQPVTRTGTTISQARDQIVLHLNDDELDAASAANTDFFQLHFTNDTVSNLDDTIHLPTGTVYDAVANTVTLTFADDISNLSGAGTYRLRVGTAEVIPNAPVNVAIPGDPGNSGATATDLGVFAAGGNSSQLLSTAIEAQPFQFAFPGANDEPGNRQIEVESHLLGGADGTDGPSKIPYNFQTIYGTDPAGNPLTNQITEAQRTRGREIFEFYSTLLGIDFQETATDGLTIVTGDLRALDPAIPTGPGGVAGLAGGGIAIMDQAEVWNDQRGQNWFQVAMHEIGHLLGLGHTYELPELTVQGAAASATRGNSEPDFPGDNDIEHGQHLHRPDSIDVDLYKFEIPAGTSGLFTAEIMAERLANSSDLDAQTQLFRQNDEGQLELIAQNDDYFSEDSYIELLLDSGVYFIGVSSTGNDAYDPNIANTGLGGTSSGAYDLQLNFRPDINTAAQALVDTAGTIFDGDGDGEAGGIYNYWFSVAAASDTQFVDKLTATHLAGDLSISAPTFTVQHVQTFAVGDVISIGSEQMQITAIDSALNILTVIRGFNGTSSSAHSQGDIATNAAADGSLANPFGTITDALNAASEGDVVRIVGNGGIDGDVATTADNFAYQIGRASDGSILEDGANLEVPKNVTVVFDNGAITKLRNSRIAAGSASAGVDRSGGALQVLGTPGTGNQVTFTSLLDETIGNDTTLAPTTPAAGNWGGLTFQEDVDRAQGRFAWQSEGIFLNHVGFADIRYGGGSVIVDSVNQVVNPIFITGSQPTIAYNSITLSSDAAMSANPDSFEEISFQSPRFQDGAPGFTGDYTRTGPDIQWNTLTDNTTNGIEVRITTRPGAEASKLTVPGRFDDVDIVHVVSENLSIQGTPGGAIVDAVAVNSLAVVPAPANTTGGTLSTGTYNYRVTFFDRFGVENPASLPTIDVSVAPGAVANPSNSVNIQALPPATGEYVGRRIYRSASDGAGPYTLIAELDRSATSHLDLGENLGRELNAVVSRTRSRRDARLSVDPGVIVKLSDSRIESEVGAQLIAEGVEGQQIIFTSRNDDTYGRGGTFDTNNDSTTTVAAPGDFGGLYIGHLGSVSLDHARITYGGGIVAVNADFAGFNALEIHQAEARISNSVFANNASGQGGTAPDGRFGLLPNGAGTIFVRGAQPVIIDNDFDSNAGAVININANSLNKELIVDSGRSTGAADNQLDYGDNQGPLIRDNRLGNNEFNALQVRGETLTTAGVWDDVDIVHAVFDEIYVPDHHTYGGLRLESAPEASLVIKLQGTNAGFSASGQPLDIVDRIGGSLQIIGQPGQPVIMTSLSDDNVGAGFGLDDLPLRDTNNDGVSTGTPGEWRGIQIEQFAHDRNVGVYVENEVADRLSPSTNSTISSAEVIGLLATNEQSGDENLRLGFVVHGIVDSPDDQDIYSFEATAGTSIWLDIDNTSLSLDSVVELLDADGNIIAISDNINDAISLSPGTAPASTLPLSIALQGRDLYTLNALDAGLRVRLPGTSGTRQSYSVRVRSSNIDSTVGSAADLLDQSKLGDGLTTGVYELQVRLQEENEFPGSTVTFADIRFATNGIRVTGHPAHSPLVGEVAESIGGSTNAGNVHISDRGAVHISGSLAAAGGTGPGAAYDSDQFTFTVGYANTQEIDGVANPSVHFPVTIDLDFADQFSRADSSLAIYNSAGQLVLIGRDSNIADDQAKPLDGSDIDDLSRGSAGTLDPFIGPVELPADTYTLTVIPNALAPTDLNQYWQQNPQSSFVRLEPVNSTQRIAEERFGADLFSTATAPTIDLFTTDGDGNLAPEHVVPFNLSDVTLFVSSDNTAGGNRTTSLRAVDPFSGTVETVVGTFSSFTGDIATRADGQLHTISIGPVNGAAQPTDAAAGAYLRIDAGTAATTNVGGTGIQTFQFNNAAPPAAVAHDVGIQFRAIDYLGTTGNSLFGVGSRTQLNPKAGQNNVIGSVAAFNTNILYAMNIANGSVPGGLRQNNARATAGAGTAQVEVGQINAAGTVSGLADLGTGVFFAVDDTGGLYTVNPNNAATTFITTVTNPDTGVAVDFAGLARGPENVEGGAYADLLFAVDTAGLMYAMDATGTLQPIFVDAQTTLDTGINNANGLDFGTLDYNLWHTTNRRGADAGHGNTAAPFDNSTVPTAGGASLYFGFETGANNPDPQAAFPGYDNRTAGNQNTDNNNNPVTAQSNNFNFPGGAHGSTVSNTFSLEGYSSSDKPALYFNYLLDTEDTNFNPGTSPHRDSFRVFVQQESGAWNLLATNDSFESAGLTDQFDFAPDTAGAGQPVSQTHPNVAPLFDGAGWRQARVDLSNYAGLAGLKLRFDFSTAGTFDLGNELTRGSELYAPIAAELTDGQTFTLFNNSLGVLQTFEFDLGAHLTVPTGTSAIGESFTVLGSTFTYVDGVTAGTDIGVLTTDSAQSVAAKTLAAVNALLGPVASQGDTRLTFATAPTITGSGGLVVEGGAGVAGGGAVQAVQVDIGDSPNVIATTIRQAMADVFSGGDITNIKGSENLINVIGSTIVDAGPLASATALPGDEFGTNAGRGVSNASEGVLLDDIIIGFAERGEQVTNASGGGPSFVPNNDVFNPNIPLTYVGINDGTYDVEIRRASDFGTSQAALPNNVLDRAIDTNDREVEGVSFSVPSIGAVPNKSTFTITDGVGTVTYEFIDVNSGTTVEPGNLPIVFDSLLAQAGTFQDGRESLAALIVAAINSQPSQDVLESQATMSNTQTTGGFIIHLTGNGVPEFSAPIAAAFPVQIHDAFGDSNHHRDQGQIIISASTISDSAQFGVISEDVTGGVQPGVPRNTQEINVRGEVPGVVIMNNVIANNGAGAILFSGDAAASGLTPYGRIVNNTLVGGGRGTGISVTNTAAPVILNNILSDFANGITVDVSSASGTVVGSSLYHSNTNDSNVGGDGDSPLYVADGDPLFVDAAAGNYYLAAGSTAIDSARAFLADRADITRVKSPLGLGPSPVVAPLTDVFGQLRQVGTPGGSSSGSNVIDRGAIDRVDFFQPIAVLASPEDNSAIDDDPEINQLWINQPGSRRQFRLTIEDQGIGVDDSGINSSQFVLQRDGIPLRDGLDYIWSYNSVTNEIIFTSVTEFAPERFYDIIVDNTPTGGDGVKDLAGNYLAPNQSDGSTRFRILLTDGINDAPINTVPSRQTINEDSTLVFDATNAISVSDADVHLAPDPKLTITLSTTEGILTLGSTSGITFPVVGEPNVSSVVTINGSVEDLNTALESLTFTPPAEYFNLLPGEDGLTNPDPVVITVTTNDGFDHDNDPGTPDIGQFAGIDSPVAVTTSEILVNVVAVNDRPDFNRPVADPAAVDEDRTGVVSIANFVTGMSPGPASEAAQTTSFSIQSVNVLTGNLAFIQAPALADNGTLTYELAPNTNGTADITFVLIDANAADPNHLPATSLPETVQLVVNPINDEPEFTLSTSSVSSNEDQGPRGPISLIASSAAGPAGATDETAAPPAGQTLTFSVDTPAVTAGDTLVLTQFAVDANGMLTYEAAEDTFGTATFNIWVTDDGPTAHAMDDNQSDMQQVTITVNPVNDAPVPVTPLTYVIDEGDDLVLDGTASSDADPNDTLTYEWDLNNDGTADATGANPTVTFADLASLNLTAGVANNHPVTLSVTDTFIGTTVSATATLTILTVDYGDAPNTYGTEKASNGAAHTIVDGFFLGASVDNETDGSADDGADEDGIVFEAGIQADADIDTDSFFTATVSAAGKLDIWLDFNNDGVFDTTEHLNEGVSFDVVAGENTFTFPIKKGTAVTGVDTYARARFSSAGGLSPTGRATDGEVEDYQLQISDLLDAVGVERILPAFSDTSDRTPLLQWQPLTGSAAGANVTYNITLLTSVGDGDLEVVGFEENFTGTSIEITTPLDPGAYTVQIQSFNRAGVPGPITTFDPFDVIQVAITSPNGDLPNGLPTITWTEVPDTTGSYELQIVSSITGNVFVDETGLPASQASYTVTSELPIGSYRVRTRAIEDTTGQPGDWSAFETFNVRTAPAITAPTGDTTDTTPEITWTAVPGAASYELRVFDVTDDMLAFPTITGIIEPNFTLTTPLELGEYTFEVRAFTAQGAEGEWSTPLVSLVGAPSTISQPTGRVSDSTPTIAWSAVPGAENYSFAIVDSSTSTVVFEQTGLTATQFTVGDSLPLGDYEVTVTASNLPAATAPAGTATASVVSAASQFSISTAPVVTAPAVGIYDTTPTIVFETPEGTVTSELELLNGSGVSALVDSAGNPITITGIVGNEHTLSTPLPTGQYRVRIRSFGDNGGTIVSDWSEPHFFQIGGAPTVLGPVTGLGDAPFFRTVDSNPFISWEGQVAGETYDFWLASVTTGQAVQVVRDLDTQSFQANSLAVGQYRVWVRAQNGLGDFSPWSVPYDFQVATAPTVDPIGASFTTQPITWNPPAGTPAANIASYRMWINNIDNGGQVFLIETDLTTTEYIAANEFPDGRYRVWTQAFVNATNPNGGPTVTSEWSEAVTFEVSGRPEITSLGTIESGTPLFDWPDVNGAIEYEIFVSSATNPSTPIVRERGFTDSQYQLNTTLTAGDYIHWVRARSATDISPWSRTSLGRFTVSGATGSGDRPVVEDIATSADRTPTIVWSAVDNAVVYDVYIAQASNANVAVYRNEAVSGTTHDVATDLLPGDYRVWVRAITGTSTGPWSVPVSFTVVSNEAGSQNLDPSNDWTYASLEGAGSVLDSSDVTVSLIPARVVEDSGRQISDVQTNFATIATQEKASALPVVSPVPVQEVGPQQAADADEVMAEWDDAIWAEESSSSEAVTELIEPAEKQVRSKGWLAGLAMLTPALRRRRPKSDDE